MNATVSLSRLFESKPDWCRRQIIELQVLDALPTRSTECLAALLDFRDGALCHTRNSWHPPATGKSLCLALPCHGASGTSVLTSTNLTT
ncbi:unnamed protein product [Urochloa humidicola]